jgi:N-acetylglucosaminyldiphosphoundecaprenol N-acetyl-beta-D-mannosaminyltransferase
VTPTAAARVSIQDVELPRRLNNFAHSTREIHGLLGIPIDVTTMRSVVHAVESAAACATPLFISTININFLTSCLADSEFREALICSDLCTADGMPMVWLSRLMGIPMKERVAGSDLFDVLKCIRTSAPLKVFLIGGPEDVAATAAAKINDQKCGVICVGSLFPGYGSIEEMSTDAIIDTINTSKADCLIVAMGARKGHLWLHQNRDRLKIPIRAQLGATVNFQAGTIRRAPQRMRDWGLEWLYRIKEEPSLWRRYWTDGRILGKIMLTSVIPLIAMSQWHRLRWHRAPDIKIERSDAHDCVTLALSGVATTKNLEKAAPYLDDAASAAKDLVINFAGTRQIDTRFIGQLLVLGKRLKEQGRRMQLIAVPNPIARLFRLNGFGFLL